MAATKDDGGAAATVREAHRLLDKLEVETVAADSAPLSLTGRIGALVNKLTPRDDELRTALRDVVDGVRASEAGKGKAALAVAVERAAKLCPPVR